MFDVTSLLVGFAVGLLLGAALAGFWTAARLRAQTHARLIEGAERAQRAEAAVSELRRQSEQERAEVQRLRQELAEAQQARASAEMRAEEALKNLQEQKTLLSQAQQDLVEAFQALSGEALRQNNEAFLNLAKTSFETLQAEAKGELAQRQQAIDELVKPLQEALRRYEEQLHALEQSRQSAYGGLDQHLKLLAESQQRLQQETGNLVRALRVPTVRGRWGEITLKRVAELAGMVAHCDFVEQGASTSSTGACVPTRSCNCPAADRSSWTPRRYSRPIWRPMRRPMIRSASRQLRRHAAQVRARMDELSLKA